MELEHIENYKTIYKENGKTITVIREFPINADGNLSAIIEALIDIVEQEEKDRDTNDE